MRLDHLLSKEQLALPLSYQTAVRVQSHIVGICLTVASSLVEHWLFGPSVTAGPVSTALVFNTVVRNAGAGDERAEHAVGS